MILRLAEEIRKSVGGDLMFFQVAYLWRFKKQVDVTTDVIAWRTKQVIPPYIIEFLKAKL